MKKILLTSLLLTLSNVQIHASSQSTDALAKTICQDVKQLHLDKLQKYTHPSEIEDFKEGIKVDKRTLNTPNGKKILAQLNCEKPTKVKVFREGTRKKYKFGKIKVRLKNVDGKWYLMR